MNILPYKYIVPATMRSDAQGHGEFGSPRGDRTHKGEDLIIIPGGPVRSPVSGTFDKYGYCYRSDLHWRYVQITDDRDYHHRFFYTETQHLILEGDYVHPGDVIGLSQDISQKYPGMTPHVHYEIMQMVGGERKYFDPQIWWTEIHGS